MPRVGKFVWNVLCTTIPSPLGYPTEALLGTIAVHLAGIPVNRGARKMLTSRNTLIKDNLYSPSRPTLGSHLTATVLEGAM